MSRTKIFILAATVVVIAALAFAVYKSIPSAQKPPTQAQSATKTKPAQPATLPAATTKPSAADVAKGLTLGDANAPAKIEVFEDLQCPACANYTMKIEPSVISELVETGKASYTFHHYPFLDGGNPKGESRRAAEASLCASEQGKFWEYKFTVFANWAGENAGAFSDLNLSAFATSLDLDMDMFNVCFQESRYKDLIEADLKLAEKLGVQGTPSVFVNGTQVTPGFVPPFEEIKNAVEAAQP
jgi:protein-disulfide isomerase